ncbi:acyl-CoA dehydrogenase [Verminephrobacter aporrectodeae subsp. tuberculatae]|uniref:acyl-CoA dehydrogenase family protein n=1 Tax=Verminephrobacter aporrectodeae TaxID=1110389 RepID=UPI002243F5B6|nr:acyl-CoA dehydrogenase family protein [Verminephrobacter aporrectodeae]MCW8207967.1 acyl-CoA dehydrogenase [Verminephrobacter aporrectodeae subsp. tuberculatae]
MDFDFSDDQAQLRDAVRKWVDRGYGFERRRAIVAAGGFARAAWNELAALGLMALTLPEAHGGMGQGAIDAMVVAEELGRGIVLEPIAQAFIAGSVLSKHAPAAVQSAWLPRVASGETLLVLAQQERRARYRLDVCDTQASASGAGHALSGAKSLVAAGDLADAFIVAARLDGRIALFLVQRAAAGVSAQGYATQDGSRAAEVRFSDAPATLLTRDGLAALEQAVDTGIAAACAEAVGVMDRTLALTIEYLRQRQQFGVPIASFQALRHRAADMKMQLELARSMSYYASLKLDAPAAQRRAAMARAKVQLGQSMRFVGQQAVQLHGGIGVADEYIVSHYFKKLTQLEMVFGDTQHHLGELSGRMQETAGVFA